MKVGAGKMIIYGEFLFIENFISSLLILFLTGKLTGHSPKVHRVIMGSIAGAIFSFIIFIPMTAIPSIIARVITGIMCVFLTFGYRNILSKTAIYFILTFTSGGMVMALLLWIQESAINHQGIVYMESITYFKLVSFGILAFGLTYWFIKLIRSRNIGTIVSGNVAIVIDDETYEFNGYVDSGNYLKEPISGKPVVLIDKVAAKKLPLIPASIPGRFRLIPFKTVDRDYGLMESVRIDRIVYGSRKVEDAYLAFYDGVFDGYDVLLNKVFLEGGLFEDNNRNSQEVV